MSKLEKFIPLIIASGLVFAAGYGAYTTVKPLYDQKGDLTMKLEKKEDEVRKAEAKLKNLNERLKLMKNQVGTADTKKIYYPSEADIEKESVCFFLYTEILDLAKKKNIKIRSIEPNYNVSGDPFIDKGGAGNYYVCDLNMKLISNYRQLRDFIEALYQYEYYLKFNNVKITPYATDKKVLLTDFSIRIYSHTDIEKVVPDAATEL